MAPIIPIGDHPDSPDALAFASCAQSVKITSPRYALVYGVHELSECKPLDVHPQ